MKVDENIFYYKLCWCNQRSARLGRSGGEQDISAQNIIGISHAAAAADAVFVFKEQKTELLLKITEKPIRRGKWLSKSTSLTSRT